MAEEATNVEELKEEKKVDDTTATPAPGEEKKEGDMGSPEEQEEESEEESDDDKSTVTPAKDDSLDYKAELEKVKTERDNYKTALLNEKDINRKDSQNEEETAEGKTEDVAALFKRELDKSRKEMAQDVFLEELENLSPNADERELVKFHYENTIRASGVTRANIRKDLQTARLIANKARFDVTNSELRRKMESDMTKGRRGAASGQPTETKDTPPLSAADKALLKRYNISPQDVKFSS